MPRVSGKSPPTAPPRLKPGSVRWCATIVAAIGIAAFLSLGLDPVLHEHYGLFIVAVLIVSILGGARATLVGAALSLAAVAFLATNPFGGSALAEAAVFVLACIVIAAARRNAWPPAISFDSGSAAEQSQVARNLAEELNLLIDGATDYAIYMLDTDGRVAIWNKGAERLKGWTEEEVLGQHTMMFYSPQ